MKLRILVSGAFSATLSDLTPDLERASGNTLDATLAPSMGSSDDTIPRRIERGEEVDVIVMVQTEIRKLEEAGKVLKGSVVELARASMAVAVRSGAPKPPVASEDELRQTFLQARSIAVSESASGVYLREELLKHLGIEGEASKVKTVSGEMPGEVVARGEAEIVLEQLAELLPVAGIDVVGLIPATLQRVTVVAAAVPTASRNAEEARTLIGLVSSPRHYPLLRKNGLEPPSGRDVGSDRREGGR